MRAAGDLFASVLMAKAIFLDFWREKGAFTDPASSCNLPLCRKAEAAAPMLHAAAAAASAVELVGGQCYCCACGTYSNGIGCCYDDHGNQLSNSPPSPGQRSSSPYSSRPYSSRPFGPFGPPSAASSARRRAPTTATTLSTPAGAPRRSMRSFARARRPTDARSRRAPPKSGNPRGRTGGTGRPF